LRIPSLLLLMLASIAGETACRQDMQDQPKYKPLQESRFYADGRSARPIPAGTIARDELNDDDLFHTGKTNGTWTDTIPLTVNMQLLRRGRERFDIYCSPCHGRIGDGNGMIALRGVRRPADLTSARVREEPPGYIFDVITNGYGGMGDYGDQVPPHDRWAIVAYMRALELSHNATLADVPPQEQSQLTSQPQPGEGR
jgi:mono/diheme cytochrome c family protein